MYKKGDKAIVSRWGKEYPVTISDVMDGGYTVLTENGTTIPINQENADDWAVRLATGQEWEVMQNRRERGRLVSRIAFEMDRADLATLRLIANLIEVMKK